MNDSFDPSPCGDHTTLDADNNSECREESQLSLQGLLDDAPDDPGPRFELSIAETGATASFGDRAGGRYHVGIGPGRWRFQYEAGGTGPARQKHSSKRARGVRESRLSGR